MALAEEHLIPGLRFAGGYSTRLLGFSSTYVNGATMGNLTAQDIQEGR